MGLLSDELIEQDFLNFDNLFKLYSWDINPAVRHGHPWENHTQASILDLLRNIDLVTDNKGRVRLNQKQLIDVVVNHLVDPTKSGTVRGNIPEVGISSTATHVYYVINTKYKMFDEWFSASNMVARIALEKINPDNS